MKFLATLLALLVFATGAGAQAPAIPPSAPGLAKPSIYMGQVVTRTHIPDQFNAGNASIMSRCALFARDDITVGRAVFANFYDSTSAEVAPGGVGTVTASIEYPAGTFKQVLFSGVAAGTMTDGQAQLVADPALVSIPKGAMFWMQVRYGNPAGIIFQSSNIANSTLGEQYKIGSNVADNTMVASGSWVGGTTGVGGTLYCPSAFIAPTARPAFAGVGDSRVAGTGATANLYGHIGEAAPQIAPTFAYLDLARGSQTAQQVASGQFVKRATYLQYVTHAYLELGYNDLTAGRTAAQILADRATIRAFAPSLKWYAATISPGSTSTDSWATLTNQTAVASNTVRVPLNETIRAGEPGVTTVIDAAAAVESRRNSGIWKAPPMVPAAITADGVHANDNGYDLYGLVPWRYPVSRVGER